ncbi:hypothetical protein BC629DRAFT_968102 [Irpex lacteus]|nr:hypothetical protein BC629DRAFT_968102 [Irpex lacteus]
MHADCHTFSLLYSSPSLRMPRRTTVWIVALSQGKVFSVDLDPDATIDKLALAICRRDPIFKPSTALSMYKLEQTTMQLPGLPLEPEATVCERIRRRLRHRSRLQVSDLIRQCFPSHRPKNHVDVVIDMDVPFTSSVRARSVSDGSEVERFKRRKMCSGVSCPSAAPTHLNTQTLQYLRRSLST